MIPNDKPSQTLALMEKNGMKRGAENPYLGTPTFRVLAVSKTSGFSAAHSGIVVHTIIVVGRDCVWGSTLLTPTLTASGVGSGPLVVTSIVIQGPVPPVHSATVLWRGLFSHSFGLVLGWSLFLIFFWVHQVEHNKHTSPLNSFYSVEKVHFYGLNNFKRYLPIVLFLLLFLRLSKRSKHKSCF